MFCTLVSENFALPLTKTFVPWTEITKSFFCSLLQNHNVTRCFHVTLKLFQCAVDVKKKNIKKFSNEQEPSRNRSHERYSTSLMLQFDQIIDRKTERTQTSLILMDDPHSTCLLWGSYARICWFLCCTTGDALKKEIQTKKKNEFHEKSHGDCLRFWMFVYLDFRARRLHRSYEPIT